MRACSTATMGTDNSAETIFNPNAPSPPPKAPFFPRCPLPIADRHRQRGKACGWPHGELRPAVNASLDLLPTQRAADEATLRERGKQQQAEENAGGPALGRNVNF